MLLPRVTLGGAPDEETAAAVVAALAVLLAEKEAAPEPPESPAWARAGRLESHARRNPRPRPARGDGRRGR
jgi:hypothetical protein